MKKSFLHKLSILSCLFVLSLTFISFESSDTNISTTEESYLIETIENNTLKSDIALSHPALFDNVERIDAYYNDHSGYYIKVIGKLNNKPTVHNIKISLKDLKSNFTDFNFTKIKGTSQTQYCLKGVKPNQCPDCKHYPNPSFQCAEMMICGQVGPSGNCIPT